MAKTFPPFPSAVHTGRIFAAIVLLFATAGDASSHEWLLGKWTGQYSRGTDVGAVTMTFRDDAGSVKWTWLAEARDVGSAEAEGVATSVDPSSLELVGKYTAHPTRTLVGTEMRLSLKGSPAALSGTGITQRVNRPFGVELTKGK